MTQVTELADRGRRALVTGAAGGIGGAVVDALDTAGMAVAGLDIEPGDRPGIVKCDVTDSRGVDAAVDEIAARLGGLDVIVNVVGISGRSLGDGPVHECTDEAWDQVMATNARSVFLVCRAALRHLGSGGSIVNISSVLGLRGGAPGVFDTHAYAASKGAVIALTRAMAASYADRGVRVNAVAPGLVLTPMSERARDNPDALAAAGARQPLTGPLLDTRQVAAAVQWLASTASDGVTGIVLPVDGGWTAT
jgi:NAD(P)-dependent dehydrogenase (short-subunit alcohol dehydrogenase family)